MKNEADPKAVPLSIEANGQLSSNLSSVYNIKGRMKPALKLDGQKRPALSKTSHLSLKCNMTRRRPASVTLACTRCVRCRDKH
jgi:hypothetical protein